MHLLTLSRLVMLGLLACCFLGCQNEFSDPVWNPTIFSKLTTRQDQPLKWSLTATEIGNGVSGCESLKVFRGGKKGIAVEARLFRYKNTDSSQLDYDRMSGRRNVPLYRRGNVAGFDYTISSAWRPRSDPEGGGFFHDRRITYLVFRKNVSVVGAEIYSAGTSVPVDVTAIAQDIRTLVGEW